MSSPDVGAEPNTLRDVAVAAPDDAWAVGWRIAGSHYRTLAQHWDGSTWSVVPTPGLGSGDAVLTGVAALSSQDVWSVGWVMRDDGLRPVVDRVFAFAEIREALRYMESGAHFGKICLRI